MKIVKNGVNTSRDLLKEFFAMSDRMINNMSEKARYDRIGKYLIEQGAKKIEPKAGVDSKYNVFELRQELYLIPKEIFDELDEEWQKELDDNENPNTKVAL